VFSGKHDNSVMGVANKDYDAASIANEVMFRMFERKVVDKAKIRSIYKSETFPTTGYGYAHNLDPKLVAKIKEAFFTFPWEGSSLKAEFKKSDRFVPITYKKDWSIIRKIDAANGVKYACK
jgi:phosphonate transport system substrate-binding protein